MLWIFVLLVCCVSAAKNNSSHSLRTESECPNEDLNVFDPPAGYAPSNCSFYDNYGTDWMPNAYLRNAQCACSRLGYCASANCVRKYIQVSHLEPEKFGLEKGLREEATAMKKKSVIPIEYSAFVQNKLVPWFYKMHVDAYEKCGCPSGPAGYWAWKAISFVPLPCSVVKVGILYKGSCHGKFGSW